MNERREFYQVVNTIWNMRLPDHLEHGYETERDFRQALDRLVTRWRGRVGESIGERHGFLLLRFHDTPGGMPDEEWLPRYLLKPVDAPPYIPSEPSSSEELTNEIDRAYGFD